MQDIEIDIELTQPEGMSTSGGTASTSSRKSDPKQQLQMLVTKDTMFIDSLRDAKVNLQMRSAIETLQKMCYM